MSKTWDELVEIVAQATAMHYAHNRMPVMSGNPLDRLHPNLKRECYDGARAALTAITQHVALMPREATEKMKRPMRTSPKGSDLIAEAFYTAMLAAGEIKEDGQ